MRTIIGNVNGIPMMKNGYYFVILKHGFGPGVVPSDVEFLDEFIDIPGKPFIEGYYISRRLTPEEVERYDIVYNLEQIASYLN